MKPVRIIFLYSAKQPDITKRHVRFFQTNLNAVIKSCKVKPIFEVKSDTVPGINMRYRDLDAGKEVILENMEEIQQYFGMGVKQKKNVDNQNPDHIAEEFSNYILDIADQGDDDIKDEKDDKYKKRADQIRSESERKKNEFKKQFGNKTGGIGMVGKRVSIGKTKQNTQDPSDIQSNISRRPPQTRMTSRTGKVDSTNDDYLIRSKIEQSNGSGL